MHCFQGADGSLHCSASPCTGAPSCSRRLLGWWQVWWTQPQGTRGQHGPASGCATSLTSPAVRSLCLIAGPGCVFLTLRAARSPASTGPSTAWERRLLSMLVPTVICGHLSEGISHGLADGLCQFRDILWAQALGFYLGEDSDGARPWREKGRARDAVRRTHQEPSSTTSCLPTPQCPTKRPPSPTCLIPTASPAFQQLGFLPVTYRR